MSLKDISVSVGQPSGPDPSPHLKDFNQVYRVTSFRIEDLELSEFFYINEGLNQIVIAQTRVIGFIYDCIFKNHPMYIDTKVNLLIPFLRIHIDDQMVFFCEIMKLAAKASPNKKTDGKEFSSGHNIFTDLSTSDGNKLEHFDV